MDKAKLIELAKHYWPAVVAALPSLITALTAYPRAAGVVKVLRTLLDLASVLTHKDSAGTLKLPLTKSAQPASMVPPPLPSAPGSSSGHASTSVMIAIVAGAVSIGLACLLSGCAGGPVFGSCLKNVAAPDAEAVVTAVVEIASNPTGYIEALIELGKQLGPNVVSCVAKAIAADEAAKAAKPHHEVVRAHLNEYLGVMQAHGAKLSCR